MGVSFPSTHTSSGTQSERRASPNANGKPVYFPIVPSYANAGVRSRHAWKRTDETHPRDVPDWNPARCRASGATVRTTVVRAGTTIGALVKKAQPFRPYFCVCRIVGQITSGPTRAPIGDGSA